MALKTHCDYCHQPIAEGHHPYTLRLELFPAVEPSLELGPLPPDLNLEEEMRRLLERMERMDEGEVEKQEQLMYVAHSFTLCGRCREAIAEQLGRLGQK